MQLAIDIYYLPNQTAKCVGVLFNWEDKSPQKFIVTKVENVAEYIPGEFYLRELPCVLAITDLIDLTKIETAVVDGHVQLGEGKKGLGEYVYEALDKKIPVIGVAKRSYHTNKQLVKQVLRGNSSNPLHVSAIGVKLEWAAQKVAEMHGEYRIPDILKKLDQVTKEPFIGL